MAERLFGQGFQCFVVAHVGARIIGGDQAVLSVAGVGVERDVGDDAKFGELPLQRGDDTRHQTVRVPGFFRACGLERHVDDREQRQRRYAQTLCPFGGFQQVIEALPFDAGHRRDRFNAILAVEDEHRVDQIVGGQDMFSHQAAGEVIAAHPAHPRAGEAGSRIHAWLSEVRGKREKTLRI